MTIYGNDDPDFLAQALKTDKSLEPKSGNKMMLTIMNEGENMDILLSEANVDDKFFELMCEFLYARSKMNMMGNSDIEDLHSEAVKKVVNIINEMPITSFKPQDARTMLNKSRGRSSEEGMEDE